jgi:hypothetical protein
MDNTLLENLSHFLFELSISVFFEKMWKKTCVVQKVAVTLQSQKAKHGTLAQW